MQWRPLAGEDERARILAAVRRTAREVARLVDAPGPDAQLGRGDPGFALLLAYLAAEGDEWAIEPSFGFLERGLEALAAGQRLPTALFDGWLGVAWVTEHLRIALAIEDDINDDVAPALAQMLERRGAGFGIELAGGLAGIAVFAAERGDDDSRAVLEQVTACLERKAIENGGERTWWVEPQFVPASNRSRYPDGLFDLGVAHGVPGVLVALARCHMQGVPGAAELCRGGVRWLLAQELPDGSGSAFPGMFAAGELPQASRLAWCYGDAGIAASLAATAQALGDGALLEKARLIGRRAALRAPHATGVDDASLCHGSAGLGLIFQRLWNATGDDAFAGAARFWLGDALTRLEREPVWTHGPALLTGKTGVALALLAAASEQEPGWDSAFGLSV
jgi:hypothetical protein